VRASTAAATRPATSATRKASPQPAKAAAAHEAHPSSRSTDLLAALLEQPDDGDSVVIGQPRSPPPSHVPGPAPQRASEGGLSVTLDASHRQAPGSAADFEERWDGQPHDATRTREMTAYLQETARAAGLDPEVVSEADCTSGMCRVELDFADPGEALAFQSAAQNPSLSYNLRMRAPQPAEAGEVSGETERPGRGFQVEMLLDEIDAEQAEAKEQQPASPEAPALR
jgi:hypothetical protein